MQIPTTLIRQARQDELPAVAAMYEQAGYKGTASPSDMVIVAVHDGRIIGAVRLCDEFGTSPIGISRRFTVSLALNGSTNRAHPAS